MDEERKNMKSQINLLHGDRIIRLRERETLESASADFLNNGRIKDRTRD